MAIENKFKNGLPKKISRKMLSPMLLIWEWHLLIKFKRKGIFSYGNNSEGTRNPQKIKSDKHVKNSIAITIVVNLLLPRGLIIAKNLAYPSIL